MKTVKQTIIAIAIAITALTACDTNDAPETPNRVKVVIIATIDAEDEISRQGLHANATRATDVNGYDGVVKKAFVEGDEIIINYRAGNKSAYIPSRITRDANGSWNHTTDLYIDPNHIDSGDIYATYDKDLVINDNDITTFHDALKANATITPPTDGSDDPYIVSLQFKHTYSLITITVYIDELQVNANNIASIIIHTALGRIVYKTATDGNRKCIIPNNIQSIDIALTDGSNYSITPSSPIVFTAGRAYNLNIKITANTRATTRMNGEWRVENGELIIEN